MKKIGNNRNSKTKYWWLVKGDRDKDRNSLCKGSVNGDSRGLSARGIDIDSVT